MSYQKLVISVFYKSDAGIKIALDDIADMIKHPDVKAYGHISELVVKEGEHTLEDIECVGYSLYVDGDHNGSDAFGNLKDE